MMKKKFSIGFMQGRIVGSENKKFIQFFPSKNWINEFRIAKKNHIRNVELTANLENLIDNPVYNENLIKKYFVEKKKNRIIADSLTCDFFMQKPFFKLKKENSKIHKKILEKIIKTGQKIGIKKFVLPLVDNSSIKNKIQENKLRKYLTSRKFQAGSTSPTCVSFGFTTAQSQTRPQFFTWTTSA